jgi:DNA-binding response OmpR family regulator
MKIGIIDDDNDICEILEFNLRKEGYETFTAVNGKLGIQKCIEHKPDLIILDVMMPEMDGMEVCEILRKTPGLESLLICLVAIYSWRKRKTPDRIRSGVIHSVDYFRRAFRFSASEAMNSSVL